MNIELDADTLKLRDTSHKKHCKGTTGTGVVFFCFLDCFNSINNSKLNLVGSVGSISFGLVGLV